MTEKLILYSIVITSHYSNINWIHLNKKIIFPFSGRQADDIQRRARQLESRCMNNEADIEDLEKLLYEARAMYTDSDKKLDENTRRLVSCL